MGRNPNAQTRTTVVNIKNDLEYDIYIGRGSYWGNPFRINKHRNRKESIRLYKKMILSDRVMFLRARRELKGKVLGCWCKPLPCHGDILAAIANGELKWRKAA